jgi:hypothetical protein
MYCLARCFVPLSMLQPDLEASLEQRLSNPEDLFEGLSDLAQAYTSGNTSSMWQQLQQRRLPPLPIAASQLEGQLLSPGANAGGSSRNEGQQHEGVALQARDTADVLLRELETSMARVARKKP